MGSFVEQILNWTLALISQWGYSGVFFVSLLDRVTISLIPTEVVVPLFGALVKEGTFSFLNTLIWVTLGSLIGEIILYYLSMWVGRAFLEKYGKYVLVSKHDLQHLDKLFEKYGNNLIFWGRLMPVARAIVALPAGISRFSIKKFTLYSLLGMLPYNIAFLLLGYYAYDKVGILIGYVSRFDLIGIGILAAAIVFYIYRHLKRRHLSH